MIASGEPPIWHLIAPEQALQRLETDRRVQVLGGGVVMLRTNADCSHAIG